MKLNVPSEVTSAQLEEYRRQFEAGDKNALISAIRFAFNEEIVAPKWIVDAFFRATNAWYSMEVKELGEAFGLKWPKGKNLAAAKKKRRLMFLVYNAIEDVKQRRLTYYDAIGGTKSARRTIGDRPIDDLLFAEIGKPLGIEVTLVKEYYASARKLLKRMPTAAAMLIEKYKVPAAANIAASKRKRKSSNVAAKKRKPAK